MLQRHARRMLIALCLCGSFAGVNAAAQNADKPWVRHTIDDSSRGADGVRLADVNGDGLMDIATGWEEGGAIRAYLHPGHDKAKAKWPAVTVGKVSSPEDAVFVDLDGDGAVDVVSSCEGKTRTMYVHWAPKDPAKYLDASAWKTEPIPATAGQQMWMYCLPMQLDGKHGVDLVVGSKGGNATVGWLEAPANPRDLKAWTFHPKYNAGWIMSLIAADMDGDGDQDVIVSDRKGKQAGVLWLENPGAAHVASGNPWKQHHVGLDGEEVMFLDTADVNGDGRLDMIAAVKPNLIVMLKQGSDATAGWSSETVTYPLDRFGRSKAVRYADLDLDGRRAFIVSCEGASAGKSGVFTIVPTGKDGDAAWRFVDVSGPAGVKFDLLQLLDLDGDGDLDVIGCEESDNLGVFWYENPAK